MTFLHRKFQHGFVKCAQFFDGLGILALWFCPGLLLTARQDIGNDGTEFGSNFLGVLFEHFIQGSLIRGIQQFFQQSQFRWRSAGLLQNGNDLLQLGHAFRIIFLVCFLKGLVQHLDKSIIYFLDVTGCGLLDVIRCQEGV